MYLGQVLLRYTPVWLVIYSLLTLAFGLADWQILRNARRAEAFLRAHPDPAEGSGGGEIGAGPRPVPGTMAD